MSDFLNHKIDFVVAISVQNANPNGDPLLGNRPRTNFQGHGVITDVCIKRKIRNRLADMGHSIFVQANDRSNDGFDSLQSRAEATLSGLESNPVKYHDTACSTWIDVRSFGQLFAFNGKKKGRKSAGEEPTNDAADSVSIGVRGPVSIQSAVSITPVEVEEVKITKSVNGIPAKNGKKSSDTLGDEFRIPFGIYVFRGSINSRLAEKTGFTQQDADAIHEALKTLFVNDESSARPSGSMEVLKVYWFEHPTRDGSYPSGAVHRSVQVTPNNEFISGLDNVSFALNELSNLPCNIYSAI